MEPEVRVLNDNEVEILWPFEFDFEGRQYSTFFNIPFENNTRWQMRMLRRPLFVYFDLRRAPVRELQQIYNPANAQMVNFTFYVIDENQTVVYNRHVHRNSEIHRGTSFIWPEFGAIYHLEQNPALSDRLTVRLVIEFIRENT